MKTTVKIGDIVLFKKYVLSDDEYLIIDIYVPSGFGVYRLGTEDRYYFLCAPEVNVKEVVRHIPTENIDRLVEEFGLHTALIMRQKNLPERYLEGLESQVLEKVRVDFSGSQFHWQLTSKIRQILISRSDPNTGEVITAIHVISVCLMQEKKCCFIRQAEEFILCAKFNKNTDFDCFMIETGMTDGIQNCGGRKGKVSLACLSEAMKK